MIRKYLFYPKYVLFHIPLKLTRHYEWLVVTKIINDEIEKTTT